ncbi:MAG: hypothetical protein B6245_21290 [Desulfobacteraceae bacterium 4572_88]|nr:MAG: hypothetical protein B6245_21290 [Desulfobacteraceae bacterium 4572_88]
MKPKRFTNIEKAEYWGISSDIPIFSGIYGTDSDFLKLLFPSIRYYSGGDSYKAWLALEAEAQEGKIDCVITHAEYTGRRTRHILLTSSQHGGKVALHFGKNKTQQWYWSYRHNSELVIDVAVVLCAAAVFLYFDRSASLAIMMARLFLRRRF